MKKKSKITLCVSLCLLAAFGAWTALISFVNVKEIGPHCSAVGFSTINGAFHKLTGVNMLLYTITDWLGLIPIAFAFGFAVLGLIQWIKRKNILKVDFSILILGCFYIITIAAYLLFETMVINYRPVLSNGFLEASYPSSTTLLVLCVMPTAIMQLNTRIKNKILKSLVYALLIAFIIFMVVGRLISGVHWLTDIIGGLLLSAGLVLLYYSIVSLKQ